MFLLPKRRVGLQTINKEGAGRKRVMPMAARGANKDNPFPRSKPPDPVNDDCPGKAPPGFCLVNQRGQRSFRHARIMFQRQCRDPIVATHKASKTRDRPGIERFKPRQLFPGATASGDTRTSFIRPSPAEKGQFHGHR